MLGLNWGFFDLGVIRIWLTAQILTFLLLNNMGKYLTNQVHSVEYLQILSLQKECKQ